MQITSIWCCHCLKFTSDPVCLSVPYLKRDSHVRFNSFRGWKLQIFLLLRVFKMECQYFYPNSYHLWLVAEKKMHKKKRKERAFNEYMLFTGWEVHIGRNCARGLEYLRTQTKGTVSPNTDRPRPVNKTSTFSNWDLKVSGKFSFTLQPMCVEVGRVRVDEAHDRLQTKPKHYNMIFSSVIYIMAVTALF